jgi:hypothetical protein
MQVHAKRKFVIEMKKAIYETGEKMEWTNRIGVVGPID